MFLKWSEYKNVTLCGEPIPSTVEVAAKLVELPAKHTLASRAFPPAGIGQEPLPNLPDDTVEKTAAVVTGAHASFAKRRRLTSNFARWPYATITSVVSACQQPTAFFRAVSKPCCRNS
jgi:hypothetical protein